MSDEYARHHRRSCVHFLRARAYGICTLGEILSISRLCVSVHIYRIHATYRWCVTGTPIGNKGLTDIYGLMVFLAQRPWNEQRWWEHVRCFFLQAGKEPFFDGFEPKKLRL